jgi:protein phosphatase
MDGARPIKITVFGKTDVGLIREHNEDCFMVADANRDTRSTDFTNSQSMEVGPKGALFLVCDGMGGAAAGEVASHMAIDSISAAVGAAGPQPRDAFARGLRRAIEDANDKIYLQSRDNQSERGMGTTCTAVGVVDANLVVAQIGDSRCYVLREGRLAQVTKDQSLAWQLIEAGAMTAEEAKAFEHANIILQALGVQERVEVALSQVALRRGDVILLSSDGLHGPVGDDEIRQILSDERDVKTACEHLIKRALEREGPDNVTVVVARFDGEGLAQPTAEDIVGFERYDPGSDPSEARPARSERAEKATVEMNIPMEMVGITERSDRNLTGNAAANTDRGDLPLGNADAIAGAGATDASPRQNTSAGVAGPAPRPAAAESARPLATFMVLTLIAAAAGALFLKYERSRALELEARAESELRTLSEQSAPAPPPVPAQPPTAAPSPAPGAATPEESAPPPQAPPRDGGGPRP